MEHQLLKRHSSENTSYLKSSFSNFQGDIIQNKKFHFCLNYAFFVINSRNENRTGFFSIFKAKVHSLKKKIGLSRKSDFL